MAAGQGKMATDNNPNIIVTLVARSHRAHEAWADSHNEPFYIPPKSHARDGRSREGVVGQNDNVRQPTPDEDDPTMIDPSEPALQITFGKKPRNPQLGYLLGSDRKVCDIFFGSTDDWISQRMFIINLNQYNEVTMTSLTKANVVVSYGKQQGTRKKFTWVFPPEQKSIFVKATKAIEFTVEVPKHKTDQESYMSNCRKLLEPVNRAGRTTSEATMDRPFYLRTAKIGDGGFGKVHQARSMPDGRVVAVKQFKSKRAFALEAGALQKIAKKPHDNIVEFIDQGLGEKPYLVLGIARGGNLDEQHKYMPFTNREIGLILYQMLEALDFLHDDCKMIHRDVKSANILCDSRTHFRLADFGLAKEGEVFKSHKGTKPWMAPEVFENKGYTALVDIWGLGLVICRLMTNGFPPGFRGDEGVEWCAAVVAHFQEYSKRSRADGARGLGHIGLTMVVEDRMLRMEPEERDSACGCLVEGDLMCWRLDTDNGDISNMFPEDDTTGSSPNTAGPKTTGLNRVSESQEEDENDSLGGDDFSEENDSEAVTEVPEARPLDTDEWESLERAHPIKEANSGDEGARHYINTSFVNQSDDMPQRLTTADSDENSESQPSRRTEVQKRLLKRKRLSLSNAED